MFGGNYTGKRRSFAQKHRKNMVQTKRDTYSPTELNMITDGKEMIKRRLNEIALEKKRVKSELRKEGGNLLMLRKQEEKLKHDLQKLSQNA